MERAVKDPKRLIKGRSVLAQVIQMWNRGCAISIRELHELTCEYSNCEISGTAFSEIQRQKRPNPGPALFIALGDINQAAARIQGEMTAKKIASKPIERLKVIRVNGETANAGDFLMFFFGESEPDNDLTQFEWTETLMNEAVTMLRKEVADRCISLRSNPFAQIDALADIAAEIGVVHKLEKRLFAGWLTGFGERPDWDVVQRWLDGFSLVWERWTGSRLDPRSLVQPDTEL